MIKSKCKFLAYILFILIPIQVSASKVDSLLQLDSNVKNDSLKVEYRLKIGLLLEANDFDSAMVFYKQALELSKGIPSPDLEAKSLANIGFAYMYNQSSKISIDYLQKALSVYQSIPDSNGILNSYYNLGSFYSSFEDYAQAIIHFKLAASIGEVVGNQQMLGKVYNNLGLIYQYSGHYDKANEYQFMALKIKEETKDPTLSFTHFNIGLNYFQQELYDESLAQYMFVLEIFKAQNDRKRTALCYKNMGDVYAMLSNYEKATEMYNQGFGINTSLGDKEAISEYYYSIGKLLKLQKEWYAAYEKVSQAIRIFPEKGSQRQLFFMYSSIAEIMLESHQQTNDGKDLVVAINNGHGMLNIANSTKAISLQNKAYEILYRAYDLKGDRSQALKFTKLFISSQDSLLSEQKQKAISEMQTLFEVDKKALEIDLLNSENDLITTELKHSDKLRKSQTRWIYGLIGGISLVSILVFLIYYYYKKTKESNTKLEFQNKTITKQKQEKEILLNEIHHRVKNNLQIVSGLLEMQSYTTDNNLLKEKLKDSQRRIQSIANVHNILYTNDQDVDINFSDFVDRLTDQIFSGLKGSSDEISLDINIPVEIKFNIDLIIPLGLILNELFTNALKYAFCGGQAGKLSVQLELVERKYILTIKDNGPGVKGKSSPFENQSMGMMIIKSLAQQIKSELDYSYEKGAIFTLRFNKE